METVKKNFFPFICGIIFVLSVLQIVVNVNATFQRHNLIDFSVYRGALEKFWQGENPYAFMYAQEEAKSQIPFNYPPSTLLALSFLNILPWKETQVLFFTISLVCLWLSLWWTWKLSGVRISYPHFFLLLSFFNQTFPVKFTLVLGQVNLLVVAVTVGSVFLYLRQPKKGILSPLLYGWVCAIKLFPLVMLPLFLFRKNYLFVFLAAILFLAVSIAPSPALFREYYFVIAPAFSQFTLRNFHDQSIFAFLLRVSGDPVLAKNIGIAIVLGLYSILIFAAYLGRKAGDKAFLWMFCILFALTSVSNFFSWQHHLVFAYPLILLLYLRTAARFRLLFLIIWAVLVFHFQDTPSALSLNPMLASYQTFLILVLIFIAIFFYKKDYLVKK